ncbi:MAG: hypothetical protein AAF664_09295 [Planctomycetota bacterium]
MRRSLFFFGLLAGLAGLNLWATDENVSPEQLPALESRTEFSADTAFEGLIQTRVVVKTGKSPETLKIVSRPMVIARSGQPATVEVVSANGETLHLEIISEAVKETKD